MRRWDAQKMLDLNIYQYLMRKNLHSTAETLVSEANINPASAEPSSSTNVPRPVVNVPVMPSPGATNYALQINESDQARQRGPGDNNLMQKNESNQGMQGGSGVTNPLAEMEFIMRAMMKRPVPENVGPVMPSPDRPSNNMLQLNKSDLARRGRPGEDNPLQANKSDQAMQGGPGGDNIVAYFEFIMNTMIDEPVPEIVDPVMPSPSASNYMLRINESDQAMQEGSEDNNLSQTTLSPADMNADLVTQSPDAIPGHK